MALKQQTCEKNHVRICFQEFDCPLCVVLDKKNVSEVVTEIRDAFDDLKYEIEYLLKELAGD